MDGVGGRGNRVPQVARRDGDVPQAPAPLRSADIDRVAEAGANFDIVQLEVLVRVERESALAVVGVGDAAGLAHRDGRRVPAVFRGRELALARPAPAEESGRLDRRPDAHPRRGYPFGLAAHVALVGALPDVLAAQEMAEVVRHRLHVLHGEGLAEVGVAVAVAEELEIDEGGVVLGLVDMGGDDLSAGHERHCAPVPVHRQVADAGPAAVPDDEIGAGAVVVPRRLDGQARRAAEDQRGAAAVEGEVGEALDDDPGRIVWSFGRLVV